MQNLSLPKVFVIVLNFNGIKTLPDCLNAVFQSDYPNLEVVVVDNNSKDGSLEQARLRYSRAHFIKNSSNVGFSKGNNIGIRYALEKFADYIFLLNNDAIIEKETLSLLLQALDMNASASIVSPIILKNDNKTIWFAGGTINWRKMRTGHVEEALSDSPYKSEYLSGCAMLIKKEVFKKIGLFDERFFLYYEDADFSLRARKANFELLVEPKSHIKHLEQSNTENPNKNYWLVLSGLLFFKIHASFFQKIWICPYLLLRKIKNFYDFHISKSSAALNVYKAYKDYKKLPK